MRITRTLDRFIQMELAPGAAACLAGRTGELLAALGPDQALLDVGCGYSSPLSMLGRPFTAVDIDAERAGSHGVPAVAADAGALPFSDGAFSAVFSFGLLHHLDGVLPGQARERPAAALIRALDQGRYIRSETGLRALFEGPWRFERITYAATGLEGLWCIRGNRPGDGV